MSLKAGIIGLPNVGKSTLFNAITNSKVEAANYPFATIEPNVGTVPLEDKRLTYLATQIKPTKVINATFQFTDIAGLVAGASQGEGLGNKFLANIREVDAIVQVVRCFKDDKVTHVANTIDPIRDIEIINTELLLADLEVVTRVVAKVARRASKANDKVAQIELACCQKLQTALEQGVPIRQLDLTSDELLIVKPLQLLTQKPMLYVGNVHEDFVVNPQTAPLFQKLVHYANEQQIETLGISAKIEAELAELNQEDRLLFLQDLGIDRSGLNRLTSKALKLLNLATYFTAGPQEVKAWTFTLGMSAPECAGIIHTDFQRGFIKAEILAFDDFKAYGGEQKAKAAGKYRLEGKNYLFQDGDIALFKFNV